MQRPPSSGHVTAPWFDVLLLALLVAATSWLSLTLTRVPGGIASVWVANGLLVGWLLSRPTRLWLHYLAAALLAGALARTLVGDTLLFSLGFNGVNLLEVLLIAGPVRRQVPDIRDPVTWVKVSRIATLGTLMACALSGLLVAGTMAITADSRFVTTFLTWYFAHVIGVVLVATLTVISHREGAGLLGRSGHRLDFAASMLLIALVIGGIFAQSILPLLFLAFPPLLWAAFRHRFAGVVVGMVILSIISSVANFLGHGPFMLVESVGTTGRTVLVQLFLGAACLMTFPVAVFMNERARLAAEMRESEMQYRILADYSHDIVVRMNADGRRLYVSPSTRSILGWEPAEMLEPGLVLVHPDDRLTQEQAIRAAIDSGEAVTASFRLRHKDGHYLWAESGVRSIPSANGDGTMDIIFAARDVSERVEAQQQLEASKRELEQLARVDSLTGLANRRQFDERLALALARSRRHQSPISLLYMDIDYFKRINDSLGHLAGDAVLKGFAQRLASCVRTEDLVARLGGDEFVMLVEDTETAQVAEAIAGKLIDCIRRPTAIDGVANTVTASIGIAFCVRATDETELMWYADKALYVAKEAGRNTFHLVTME